jgi:hypothetical protein
MESIGITFGPIENDYALNLKFSENSYDSKYFFKNAGTSILLLIIYLSSWGLLLFFAMLSLVSSKMRTIKLLI